MSQPAISVEGLGKKYKIGLRAKTHDTLRDALASAFSSPLRRLRALGEHTTAADEFWALRDVSFDVQPGEVVGIIGSNGAGKSTLLKILSRITEPTEGVARIRGRVGSLLEVGTGFHPELTGRENVYLNGAILGMRKTEIDAKFDEIVAFAEVDKFLDTPVKRYSSGMRVRLAFAVAAHLQPEVLVIDEVLAVGDAAFQKKSLGKMHAAAQEGRTVLFVSHNLAAVQRLCTRAVLLIQGRVTKDGPPDAVVAAYSSSFAGTSGTVAIDDLARESPDFGQQLRVVNVRLLDANRQSTSQLTMGSPFTVELTLRATEKLSHVSLVIGIDTVTGTQVLTTASEEQGTHYDLTPGKDKHVSACFPNLLLNHGSYTIRAGARAMGCALDLVRRALDFDVLNATNDATRSMVDLSGVVRTTSTWSALHDSCSPPVEDG